MASSIFRSCTKGAPIIFKFSNFGGTSSSTSFRLYQIPQNRRFHASKYHNVPFGLSITALSGAVSLVLLRPAAKLVAMIFGRTLRKWWRSVPFSERMQRIRRFFIKNRVATSIGGGAIATSWIIFYIAHLEKVPFVQRKRFVPLTPYQYKKISDEEEEMIIESLKDEIVPNNSNTEEVNMVYHFLSSTANRILRANHHLIPPAEGREWRVILVNNRQANAFAVPSGKIFVYSGLFNVVNNENEIAMVMAHEMSHVICGHGVENLTRATILDVFLTVILASLWCIMPGDGLAVVATWFCHKVANLLFKLPFSRDLEREADAVGLDLLSRACYDPRQAAVVWRKMEIMEEILDDYEFIPSESVNSESKNYALPQFFKTVNSLTSGKEETKSSVPVKVDDKVVPKNQPKTLPTDIDFFSTHPLPAERYANICEAINCGVTAQAATEGRCDKALLSKPLPNDYDSPRRLRSELLNNMGNMLRKKPIPTS